MISNRPAVDLQALPPTPAAPMPAGRLNFWGRPILLFCSKPKISQLVLKNTLWSKTFSKSLFLLIPLSPQHLTILVNHFIHSCLMYVANKFSNHLSFFFAPSISGIFHFSLFWAIFTVICRSWPIGSLVWSTHLFSGLPRKRFSSTFPLTIIHYSESVLLQIWTMWKNFGLSFLTDSVEYSVLEE